MPMPFILGYSLVSSAIATARSFLEHTLRNGERKSQSDEAYLRRLEEMEHKARLDEQAQQRGHYYRVKEAFLSQQLAIQSRTFQKSEENSPFVEPSQETVEYINGCYRGNCKPLVLTAPFWDDTRTDRANVEGGYKNFRVPIAVEVQKIDDVVKFDGCFKRPLLNEDLDVAKIFYAVPDIPIILIYGKIEGSQRVHPAMAVWNLISGQKGYSQLTLDLFDAQKFKPDEADKGKMAFQDFVSRYVATVVAVLSDYHLKQLSETYQEKQNTEQSLVKQNRRITPFYDSKRSIWK